MSEGVGLHPGHIDSVYMIKHATRLEALI